MGRSSTKLIPRAPTTSSPAPKAALFTIQSDVGLPGTPLCCESLALEMARECLGVELLSCKVCLHYDETVE